MHREPNVGLDSGSPGSRPGPKAGAKPLHHPGIPEVIFKCTTRAPIKILCLMFYNINYMDCGEQNDAHNRTTSCEYVILCGRKGLCRYD